MALLDTYTGPWTRRHAAHLLRRTVFGAAPQQVADVLTAGLPATVDRLLAPQPAPDPPIDPTTGATYVDGSGQAGNTGRYNQYTKAWWTERILLQETSLTESMTLFWMNHFATQATEVQNAQYTYGLLSYLRANALGNVKAMTRRVTLEPAMLRYLNGNTNTAGNPNENYARELQELFTIGKGPEIGQGNYTTYTEQDVREAARVLTGWRDQRLTGAVTFEPRRHDSRDKTFSSAYRNRVISGRAGAAAGDDELDDLLDMIFDQTATERYVVRKLYRWFVNERIDDTIEREVVVPLGALYRRSGWEIAPVLATLLRSRHMYDEALRGCMLRHPASYVVGTIRTLGGLPLPVEPLQRYNLLAAVHSAMVAQQMDLGEPPNVAGWEALYQAPDYDRLWLTTATLPQRNGFTDTLVYGQRGRGGMVNTVNIVMGIDGAQEATVMVAELVERLFAVDLAPDIMAVLVEDVLQDGAPVYEWTNEWVEFLSRQNDTALRAAVKAKLDRLFVYLFRLAEFQLT